VYLVEASPHLREAQRKLLCDENTFEEIEIGFQCTSKFCGGLKIIWCEEMKFVPRGKILSLTYATSELRKK